MRSLPLVATVVLAACGGRANPPTEPMDKQLTLRWWRVPRSSIPTDTAGVTEWLYREWDMIDDWIEANREP